MPWEASFWGEVSNTIGEVVNGITGASKAPAEPVKAKPKAVAPWEDGYWEGKKPKAPKGKGVAFKTEEDLKDAAKIKPEERMPDTQSAQSNIAEIDAELARTKNPAARQALLAEKAKWERKL